MLHSSRGDYAVSNQNVKRVNWLFYDLMLLLGKGKKDILHLNTHHFVSWCAVNTVIAEPDQIPWGAFTWQVVLGVEAEAELGMVRYIQLYPAVPCKDLALHTDTRGYSKKKILVELSVLLNYQTLIIMLYFILNYKESPILTTQIF